MRIGYLMQEGAAPLVSAPWSGPSVHVRAVCEELRRLGHEVRIVARLDGRIRASDDAAQFRLVDTRPLDAGPLRTFERAVRRLQRMTHAPYAALFESLRFALACCQELPDYDILLERLGWMGYGGALASRWLRRPLVLEVNGDHHAELELLGLAPRGAQRWLSEVTTGAAVRSAAQLVATGNGWRTRVVERWQVPAERVSVVQNGTRLVTLLTRQDLHSFQPPSDVAGPLEVAFVGGFEPWQGLPVLLRAVAGTVVAGHDVALTIIGTRPPSDALQESARQVGLEARVRWLGPLPATQYARHLATCDVGVAPYYGRVEYSGLKVLDYKAAGLAVVASGERGKPGIIQHGRTGWIVPPGDAVALRDALAHLAADRELGRNLGRLARLEAESQHSWRATAEQLASLFTALTERQVSHYGSQRIPTRGTR